MQSLNEQEIQVISDTIDRSEISFSHLRDDLIDHVCCEIEQQMEQGIEFTEAFESIKNTIGIKSLQQVQEKTLLLIDKNYCVMKTTMKLSGIFSIVLLMVGTLFKIQHWPFAGIMLTLGFLSLCFFFLPSAYYIMHREKRDKKLVFLFIAAFLGSSGFLLGILFKIQHWPGGSVLLTVGILLLTVLFFPALLRYLLSKANSGQEKTAYVLAVISGIMFFLGFLFKIMHWPGGSIMQSLAAVCLIGLFIPIYTYVRYRKSEHIEVSFIYLIAAVSWLGIVGMMLSMSKSYSVYKSFYTVQNLLEEQDRAIINENKDLYRMADDAGQEFKLVIVKQVTEELDSYIMELEAKIIKLLKPENMNAIQKSGSIDFSALTQGTNSSAPATVLFDNQVIPGALKLKEKIDKTQAAFLELVQDDEIAVSIIKSLLSTEVSLEKENEIMSWEQLFFGHATVMGSISTLTALQRKLHLAEKEVINHLLKY